MPYQGLHIVYMYIFMSVGTTCIVSRNEEVGKDQVVIGMMAMLRTTACTLHHVQSNMHNCVLKMQ